MSTTDDDVRAKIRDNAIKAARVLSALMEPILDPRDFGGEVPDGSGLNRLLQTSSKSIDAWARTAEPKGEPKPDLSDADKRAETIRLFRERPAGLLELAREAGVEIRVLTTVGTVVDGTKESDGTESDP